MTLVVQIVLAVVVLVALVTTFLSAKNWHWSQVLLVLSIFLSAVGYMFLSAETVRINRNLRINLAKNQQNLESVEKQNYELVNGTEQESGILELDHRLRLVSRKRGRVWRGVMPAGEVDNQGRVQVEIGQPSPHGLEKDAIVFAFETGEPNAADPSAGPQYLGEFHVIESGANGASLEPVPLIEQRTGQRLAASRGPWSLYETMPIDSHELFAERSEEELRSMLPAESVEEYLRHGSDATEDDDQWHRAGFNDKGERVGPGPEHADQVAVPRYDRLLRDYAFLFTEIDQQSVVMAANKAALQSDIEKLENALASAKELSKFRQQQKELLGADLAGMEKDLAASQSHRDLVRQQLQETKDSVDRLLADNSAKATELIQLQLQRQRQIDAAAPAPSEPDLLEP